MLPVKVTDFLKKKNGFLVDTHYDLNIIIKVKKLGRHCIGPMKLLF